MPQIGAVLVPLNYRLTADDFAYMINHSGAQIVCVDEAYLDAVDSIRSQIKDVRHYVALEGARSGWMDYEATLAAASQAITPVEIGERDLLTINYTSGTTSRPKGVMITHRNAYINTVGTLIHLPMTPAGPVPVDIAHVPRQRLDVHVDHHRRRSRAHLSAEDRSGGRVSICWPPSRSRRSAQHRRYWSRSPTRPKMHGASARPGLRVVTAGAPPAAATIERLEGELGWTVTQMYGLTETAPFITVCETRPEHADLAADQMRHHQGATGRGARDIGRASRNRRRRQRSAARRPTLGEIVVRGNVVMDGYYNDPEATAEAFRGGWFHTGDAAVVHADGYAEIRDRFKDVIISGGENISSVEVEGTLMRHPAVQEVGVVGVAHERWGEAPHAFVVLKPAAAATERELIDFVRDRLAHFKAPHGVTFISELPKTATGKVQKYVLRAGKAAITAQ